MTPKHATAAPKRVEIYDTTLRDGSQNIGVSFSVQDKILIAEALDRLGVDYIEAGYPLSNPKDAAFFEEARGRTFSAARLVAFGMTRRKGCRPADDEGMNALAASGASVVAVVGKSWDMHVRDVLGVSEEENLAMIADSIRFLRERGLEVFFDAEHFFDGWRANADYAIRSLRAAREAGASRLILCDTNGGSLPDQITAGALAAADGAPGACLGIHCHNDGGLAVANTLAAVSAGCMQAQGTINGIGERCGNADLTAVIANLSLKCGTEVLRSGTLERLTEASQFVYEMANMNLHEGQPFVGAGAFAHKGGMHAHAVGRNSATYEHIRPGDVGNARRVVVSELSGVSNIAATAPAKFQIADDKAAQRKVLKALMDLEHQGYQFEAAEASFELLIRRTLGGQWYRRLWELDHYRGVISRYEDGVASTEVIVRLRVDGHVEHKVAEGSGPVDSLHKALREALRPHYPRVDDLQLVDYKVRVINTQAGTAARVRVLIDWLDAASRKYFGSVGVSENIIEASWLAIADAVEYKLLQETEKA
jgi:2-isopropylmalate synthase